MSANPEDVCIREGETDEQRPVELTQWHGDWTVSWNGKHWPSGSPIPHEVQRELEQWFIETLDIPTEIPEVSSYDHSIERYTLDEYREDPIRTSKSGRISPIAGLEWRESDQELIINIHDDLTVEA